MTKYVQFAEDNMTIVTLYAGPQDQADKPGYAEIADNDARWQEYETALTVGTDTQITLASKIAAGIVITSTGTPALSGTYALDATTLSQIGPVARDATGGLGLPGGGSTFSYPDASGTPRVLTAETIQGLYKAMRDCLFALNTTAATLAAGGTASWPAQTATIP